MKRIGMRKRKRGRDERSLGEHSSDPCDSPHHPGDLVLNRLNSWMPSGPRCQSQEHPSLSKRPKISPVGSLNVKHDGQPLNESPTRSVLYVAAPEGRAVVLSQDVLQ